MRQTDFFMKASDPKNLTVEQLMPDAVTRCTSRTDASMIAHMMRHRNFGSLPVVEEDGTLIGIVTEYDLLQAMLDGRDLRKVLATEIVRTSRDRDGKSNTRSSSRPVSGPLSHSRSSPAEQQAGGNPGPA